MGSVRKLICAYGVVSKQYEAHKHNQNPAERSIQEIKGTNFTVINRSGAPSWSWILCMVYVVSILNCVAHIFLSCLTPHESAYGFTPDVAHLTYFELWEPDRLQDSYEEQKF